MDRRSFLKVAAGAAGAMALGGCGSDSEPRAAPAPDKGSRQLRIAQVGAFVPAHDEWFIGEYCPGWGNDHDIEVIVDKIPFGDAQAHAASEVSAGRGHDLFQMPFPPAAFEEHTIDHRDVVTEIERRFGKAAPALERASFNPKTGKHFACPNFVIVNPVLYRTDLWDGTRPDRWEDLLRAGPGLRAAGHPLGISLSSDADANDNLFSLLQTFGAAVQDETGRPALDSPATVEAVKMATAIFKTGMTDEVLGWDTTGVANNRYLASGKASLIMNTVSALRAMETQDAALAERIAIAAPPAGPVTRVSVAIPVLYVIWTFSQNKEAASQFLIDLAGAAPQALRRSLFYNMPGFPGAIPDLAAVLAADQAARPAGKYSVLAGATEWTTNNGRPGYDNAAVGEIIDQFLIPKMFAAAARGNMTAEEAVKATHAQITPIFDKWRDLGKI